MFENQMRFIKDLNPLSRNLTAQKDSESYIARAQNIQFRFNLVIVADFNCFQGQDPPFQIIGSS